MGDVVTGSLVYSLEWCEQMKCDKASGQTLTWPPLQPTLHKWFLHMERNPEKDALSQCTLKDEKQKNMMSFYVWEKKLWRVQVIDFRKPGASAPLFSGKLSSFLFRRAQSRGWDVRPRRASFYSSAFLSSSSVEMAAWHPVMVLFPNPSPSEVGWWGTSPLLPRPCKRGPEILLIAFADCLEHLEILKKKQTWNCYNLDVSNLWPDSS